MAAAAVAAVAAVLVGAAAGGRAAALGDSDAVVLASDGDAPALEFTSREFSFAPVVYVFRDHDFSSEQIRSHGSLRGPTFDAHNDDLAIGDRYFGRVAVQARDDGPDSVRFAVEGVSGDQQLCRLRNDDCFDMLVGVREDSGLLYLFFDDSTWERTTYSGDYPQRSVEVSAEDPDSGLKVYRDVVVGPSEQTPDCGDFQSADTERFTCLFMGELLPDDPPDTSQSLRDNLPGLVQPKENYSLVFAEEFDGTPIEDGCTSELDNGMATLDASLWNYDANPCDSGDTDSQGKPCQNVADGHYFMTMVRSCRGMLVTDGKVAFKYGYIETQFTVNSSNNHFYQNYSFSIGDDIVVSEILHDDYGVVIDSYEDIARLGTMEVNLFEYIPWSDWFIAHQYINSQKQSYDAALVPTSTAKRTSFCGQSRDYGIVVTLAGCTGNGSITVALGLEWTPGGYRTFQRIHGHDDSLSIRPKDKVDIQYNQLTSASPAEFSNSKQSYTGTDRDKYFTYIDPDDTGSLLEIVAVAHRPLDLTLWAAGFPGTSHTSIRTRLRVDYIRVFQPDDLYTSMEPVYQ